MYGLYIWFYSLLVGIIIYRTGYGRELVDGKRSGTCLSDQLFGKSQIRLFFVKVVDYIARIERQVQLVTELCGTTTLVDCDSLVHTVEHTLTARLESEEQLYASCCLQQSEKILVHLVCAQIGPPLYGLPISIRRWHTCFHVVLKLPMLLSWIMK